MWKLTQWLKQLTKAWIAYLTRCESQYFNRRWQRLMQRSADRVRNGVLLHVGCGDIDSPGFINLDARRLPHVDIVTTNLFRLKMIPDSVADLIYMSHVLEHVSHREIIGTLREMRRILRTGGVLRISVPDFDKIIEIYRSTGGDINAIEEPLMGGQDYPFNYHFAAFNETHLREKMLASGFQETRPWNPLTCAHHDFVDWASRPIPWGGREFLISLNIEAIK